MTFYAFGLNHDTAPVAVREAFALDETARRTIYQLLRLSPSAEVILLSTCNRTEVYLFGKRGDVDTLQSALSMQAGAPWPDAHSFSLDDEAAVRHLLHVASGISSQVLGDAQILSQVKDAYRVAVEEDRVGTVLHRLLHTVFRAAKRVRTETALAEGAASISSLAVQAARRQYGSLAGRRVVLLGAGEMGLAALKALATDGAEITVANRSRERAEIAASPFGADVVDWSARHEVAGTADVVLVASGAAEPVLEASLLPLRPAAIPALVIDVALPRNVEPAVADLPGYELLDLDLLSQWREETALARRAALPAAEAICEEGLGDFVAWVFNHEALQPTIQALRETFEEIRQQEIARHAHRFQSVDHEQLDWLTRSIMQKLLAVPVVRLKSTDPDSLDFARGIKFLSHVFSRPGCDHEPDQGPDQDPENAGCPHQEARQMSEEGIGEDRNARQ